MPFDKEKALRDLGVPEFLFREMFREFLRKCMPAIHQIEGALAEWDTDIMEREIPIIRESAANLKIEAVVAMVGELSRLAAGEPDAQGLQAALERIKAEIDEMEQVADADEAERKRIRREEAAARARARAEEKEKVMEARRKKQLSSKGKDAGSGRGRVSGRKKRRLGRRRFGR